MIEGVAAGQQRKDLSLMQQLLFYENEKESFHAG